ncbi:hypothetical protein KM043_005561 [Ampulex compressa]|nr:hypothetical protein KM043_005561 [Ampulex compressa]
MGCSTDCRRPLYRGIEISREDPLTLQPLVARRSNNFISVGGNPLGRASHTRSHSKRVGGIAGATPASLRSPNPGKTKRSRYRNLGSRGVAADATVEKHAYI